MNDSKTDIIKKDPNNILIIMIYLEKKSIFNYFSIKNVKNHFFKFCFFSKAQFDPNNKHSNATETKNSIFKSIS